MNLTKSSREGLCNRLGLNQVLLIMKLTAILLLIGCLHLSAASYSQVITLEAKASSLDEVLKAVRQQTDYNVVYNVRFLKDTKPVTLSVRQMPLEVFLNKVLDERNLTYDIHEKTILIGRSSARGGAKKQPVKNMALQERTVTGTVSDEYLSPLPGVTVQVKGAFNAVTTDENGRYLVTIPNGAEILVFTNVGFETVEQAIGTEATINVKLKAKVSDLDEVVVVGYGTQKKVNVTGAVAAINAEEINDIPSSSLSNALNGRMAGVLFTQSGGKPGVGSSIRVRAEGTWNSIAPLYVIDGIVRDKFAFDGLDASEIENISILKDGASAAIYGSRAANGVILVTTKKGKIGKPTINYTGSAGIADATLIPKTQSGYNQAVLINDNLRIENVPGTDARYFAQDELDYFQNKSWHWLDEAWKTPVKTRHSLNVSGGSDMLRFFIGGTYYRETGSFDNLTFNRYNLRSNLEAKITEHLTASLNLNLENRDDLKPYWRYDYDNDNMSDLYKALLVRSKTIPPYIGGKPNGGYVEWHPMEIIADHTGYNRKKYGNYDATLSLEYKVPAVEGLAIKVTYNRYNRESFIKQFNRPYPLYVPKMTGTNGHIFTDEIESVKTRNDGDFLTERYDRNANYQFNTFVTYQNTFGNHSVGAVFVYEQAEGSIDWFTGTRNYFISSAVDQLYAGSPDPANSTLNGTGEEMGRLSYVGRLNYGYADKYLVEASFRYDGSVNFAPDQRWGFFPSGSVAWRISEEGFFRDHVPSINELKLRASVGLLGNDAVGGWQWKQLYNFVDNNTAVTGAQFGSLSSGITAGVVPNPYITWEKALNYNLGLDTRFWQNRMNLTVDAFYKKTYDILGDRIASLPTTFGALMPAENYARIDARGFELELGYREQLNADLNVNIRGNFGYATNKVIVKDEAENLRAYRSEVGLNTGRRLGYLATEIIRTQEDLDRLPANYTIFGQKPELGMLNYRDLRGANSDEPDGVIDENDQDWIITRSIPPVNFGLLLGAKWRALSFDVFLQGVAGNQVLISQRGIEARQHVTNFDFWTDHWTENNPNAAFPRAGRNTADSESTFWVRDGDFIRLKNVRIAYDLPRKWLNTLNVAQMRFFLTGENLALLQNKVKYYDPENSSITAYPLMKSFSLGVNLTF